MDVHTSPQLGFTAILCMLTNLTNVKPFMHLWGMLISTISWWLVFLFNSLPAVVVWLCRVSERREKAISCIDVMKVNTGRMSDCS